MHRKYDSAFKWSLQGMKVRTMMRWNSSNILVFPIPQRHWSIPPPHHCHCHSLSFSSDATDFLQTNELWLTLYYIVCCYCYCKEWKDIIRFLFADVNGRIGIETDWHEHELYPTSTWLCWIQNCRHSHILSFLFPFFVMTSHPLKLAHEI